MNLPLSADAQYAIILLLDKPFHYAGSYLTEPMSSLVSEKDRIKTQASGHKAYSLLFLIFLVCIELFFSSQTVLCAPHLSSPETDKKPVWVFFTDKGISLENDMDTAIYQHKIQTPLKARMRRQRANGYDVDISDLPVYTKYIEGVLRLGGTVRVTSRWLNGVTLEVSNRIIPEILKLPYVSSVEPVKTAKREMHFPSQRAPARNSTVRVAENYGMSTTQVQQINADALHNKGYHGEGMIIALLDTGFDLSHKALQNIRVLAEYDFVNGDSDTLDKPPEDDIGQDDHGTEVLSIIAGNSPGDLVGVAYAAEYLLAKTEKVSHNGAMFEEKIEEDWWIAGLEWAEFNGADVVSSSLGYSDWYSYSDMDGATAKTTIAAGIAAEKGLVVVVSAGNDGKSRDWPYISAPADGFDVIAVGAVNDKGELADFSSIGPTFDGRFKPDVVAMGENTYVVDPNSTYGYRQADGTSMATPLVAGVAALLLQALPDLDRPGELTKLLKFTASRALSPGNRYGWGIINAEVALQHGMSPDLMKEVSEWNPISTIPDLHFVTVYPNPIRRNSSTGRLNIYSSESADSVEIYSISSQLVYQRREMGNAKFSIWDLKNEHGEEVANGVYICVIRNSDGTANTRKIAVID